MILLNDLPPNCLPDTCRVSSDTFGDDLLGHVWGYDPRGDTLTVRLELPADHPAVLDAVGDGADADAAEFVDVVPRASCAQTGGDPMPDPRPGLADAADEVARVADAAARAERVARVRAQLAAGTRPPSFPELGPLRGARLIDPPHRRHHGR